MEIHKTRDYQQFKSITSNRDVNRLHVKKLSESIKQRNLLWAKPPIVNEKLQMIDGQHRLEACEMVKEDFFYIIGEGLTKDDMAILNTNQKNWTSGDFINFYTIEGLKDYKELSKLINKFEDLKVSMLISFAGDQGGGGNQAWTVQGHQYKEGPPCLRLDYAAKKGPSFLLGEILRFSIIPFRKRRISISIPSQKLQEGFIHQMLLAA
jgi:hypothetical protein